MKNLSNEITVAYGDLLGRFPTLIPIIVSYILTWDNFNMKQQCWQLFHTVGPHTRTAHTNFGLQPKCYS